MHDTQEEAGRFNSISALSALKQSGGNGTAIAKVIELTRNQLDE